MDSGWDITIARVAGALLLVVAVFALGLSLRFVAPKSDYQRLNAVEARLDVLEDMLR